MRFVVDAQLPPALAIWIAGRGQQAFAVRDIGMLDSPDAMIWNHARDTGAVIVTKDEDFARLAAMQAPPPQVLWLRIGNTRNAALIAALESRWEEIVARLQDGVGVVEVRPKAAGMGAQR